MSKYVEMFQYLDTVCVYFLLIGDDGVFKDAYEEYATDFDRMVPDEDYLRTIYSLMAARTHLKWGYKWHVVISNMWDENDPEYELYLHWEQKDEYPDFDELVEAMKGIEQ